MSSALSAKLDRLEASMPEEEMEVIVTLVTDARNPGRGSKVCCRSR